MWDTIKILEILARGISTTGTGGREWGMGRGEDEDEEKNGRIYPLLTKDISQEPEPRHPGSCIDG